MLEMDPSRDLSPASPLPLLSRGCTGRVCLLAQTLMLFDLLARMVEDGWATVGEEENRTGGERDEGKRKAVIGAREGSWCPGGEK
ncbi:hypothetical protein NQZ68_016620 [Dissostichus eleginoides]|nr:hypothetical protein NQZ68_016620 [Dissostichus eleginoides]